jgi:hypothetical protein
VALMVEPYREIWRAFHPLAAGSWELGRGTSVGRN